MKQFLPFIRDVLLILILVVGILLLDRNDKMVDEILERATKASAQNTSEQTAETAAIDTNTTPETAATDYNYIYFRHSNQWVTNKLICYEVVDNGQNIKFSAENSAGDTLNYYTNMANVVLMYRNEN